VADKNLGARVKGLASHAVSNPVSRTALGAAKGVTGAAKGATGAAMGATGAAVGALRHRTSGGSETEKPGDSGSDASLRTAEPTGAPAEDTLDSAGSEQEENTGGGSTGSGPDVDLLPYPDLEEPVPVVEQTLADEAENGAPVGGHATEPHASTRDEGHGDAQLQPAEQAEIAEEVAEAMPGGDLDLETPVGTTGADVGWNPDTAEADLQQPETAPGVDPGLTSSIRKDQERGLSGAQGPDEVK
jgi:hypothetical protein